MAEQSLETRTANRVRWRRAALMAGGAAILAVGGLWLARKPIAAGLIEDTCKKQGLACDFTLSRLNFGGVTLRDLALRATDSEEAMVKARSLAVDLSWTSPFSARAGWVGGDGLTVRLDATGKGPFLGDLQAVIDNLPETDPDARRPPAPRISLRNLEVITDTTMGPIRAAGQVLTGDGGVLDLKLAIDPVQLAGDGGELKIQAAELRATSDGKDLVGVVKLDLPAYSGGGSSIRDLKLDVSLAQDLAGVLGAATGGPGARDARTVAGATAPPTAELQTGPMTLAQFPAPEWLVGLKRLTITGVAGEGAIAGARWSGGEVAADISADAPGRSGGDLSVVARGLATATGAADRFELKGKVALPVAGATAAARRMTAEGTATLSGASLAKDTREAMGKAVRQPLQSALPNFAGALADSAMRAGERFELVLPWSFRLDDGGYDASALSGGVLKAASGFSVRLDAQGGSTVTVSGRDGVRWVAAGELTATGGGAPPLELTLEEARGAGSDLSGKARGIIGPWTVQGDSVSARLEQASLDVRGTEGRLDAGGTLAFGGDLGGLRWSNGRAAGEVNAGWTANTFRAEADQGLTIEWDGLAAGETKLGAGALRYSPSGPLAERKGDLIVGAGQLAAITAPVTGNAFSGRLTTSPMKLDWSLGDAVSGRLSSGPIALDLQQEDRVTPIQIAELTGALRLDKTWRLSGAFSGGSIVGQTAAADGAGGRFAISGGRRGVDGVVEKVVLRLYDPSEAEARRFEPVRFEGGAKIDAGVAAFTGELKLGDTGMVLMAVTGKHDLGSGDGGANFAGRLRFSPAFFQPARLSPLFRGPGNVTGTLALGGAATWTGETATATGLAQLDNVGFALANAGIFEGVSGRVEVSDLFNLKSDPGQTIAIRKVTLGAPFENGEIQFQLAGYDGIKLERAVWPFAGGEIRVRPSDVSFQVEGTHVVAEAFNWDLEKVMEIFKVPDVKVRGRVNGRFPVTFTTGSARIDKALLLASEEGGALQYTGSTGSAAGRADPNAKMLFDALKDFRYKLLELELDGDLAGDMQLKLRLQGSNPAVLSGGEFHINIGIDAPLMSLLNMQNNVNNTVRSVVDEISGGAN
jgi:translocation and assembly module TamB